MRHRDPRLTTETYGHLEVDDMRIALDELAAGTAPAISEAAAASDRQGFGTYLVPNLPGARLRPSMNPRSVSSEAQLIDTTRPLPASSGPTAIGYYSKCC